MKPETLGSNPTRITKKDFMLHKIEIHIHLTGDTPIF